MFEYGLWMLEYELCGKSNAPSSSLQSADSRGLPETGSDVDHHKVHACINQVSNETSARLSHYV